MSWRHCSRFAVISESQQNANAKEHYPDDRPDAGNDQYRTDRDARRLARRARSARFHSICRRVDQDGFATLWTSPPILVAPQSAQEKPMRREPDMGAKFVGLTTCFYGPNDHRVPDAARR